MLSLTNCFDCTFLSKKPCLVCFQIGVLKLCLIRMMFSFCQTFVTNNNCRCPRDGSNLAGKASVIFPSILLNFRSRGLQQDIEVIFSGIFRPLNFIPINFETRQFQGCDCVECKCCCICPRCSGWRCGTARSSQWWDQPRKECCAHWEKNSAKTSRFWVRAVHKSWNYGNIQLVKGILCWTPTCLNIPIFVISV